MKTKEEIIAVIDSTNHLSCDDCVAIKHHLTQPTLNPIKIDEERMNDISMSLYEERISPMSDMKKAVDYYNSTLEDHQVLQPLPENPPDWFNKMFNWASPEDSRKIWSEIINHYGTPTKKELVSVEELEKEIYLIMKMYITDETKSYNLAKHFHDTYSLNPPKREWWMDLKEGEKFKDGKGGVFIFDGMFYIGSDGVYSHPANKSTPYIEPSIHDKFMASLSDEQKKMYEEMKEVKGA